MTIIITILHILVFIIGFCIGTYIYNKMADGNK